MRISKKPKIEDEAEMQMTPMIDIVFQLLIFFLLSAKFIALEGQLSAFLPKDRGLNPWDSPVDLDSLTLELFWREDQFGDRVQCRTFKYTDPNNPDAPPLNDYSFNPEDRGGALISGVRTNYGPRRRIVQFGSYAVPDLDEIEAYVSFRRDAYRAPGGGTGKGLPVTVRFEDKVPSQLVVTLLDICKRQGIEDFTIAAKESPY